MSFKLRYEKDGAWIERDATPLGQFSIVTTRNNHRYGEDLNGTMIFAGDDFDFIMSAGACTEIYIECEFKRTWVGIFSHTDCVTINRSRKKLEVQPISDDEYRKIEPWMRLEMNIIPPYSGIESRVPIYTLNQYELESRTIRITEPYDGPYAENWVGYSVNDWVGNNGVIPGNKPYGMLIVDIIGGGFNIYFNYCFNSLIYYIYKDVWYLNTFGGSYTSADAFNRLGWIDPLGYDICNARREKTISLQQSEVSFRDRYWRESLFTLADVVNFYDEAGNWEYCDLIYYREIFKSSDKSPPPSGLKWDIDTTTTIATADLGTISPNSGRWIYNPSEKKWIRRYLGLHQWGTVGVASNDDNNAATGDGFDYSPLIEARQDDRRVLKQSLFRNKKAQEDMGTFWHRNLYGIAIYLKHFHKPELILHKLLNFVKEKGAPTQIATSDILSDFWQSSVNPYTGTSNIWQNVVIGQNSDVKRPLATEQATREMFSFESFLNMICTLTNTAWAIIGGKIIIEHISYFEKGLSYLSSPPIESILNPFSIRNVAKNKDFMQLTDIYSYDKPNMHKFEIYKTDGGQEPLNNNLMIEYEGGCINNRPGENTIETTIPTTTDYDFAMSEGKDGGVTFITTSIINLQSSDPEWDGLINQFMPTQDQYGRYIYNVALTLESIIKDYHNWGRNDHSAKLNNKPWNNLHPFKNVIQPVGFIYDQDNPVKVDNPYTVIATNLGYGIVRRVEHRWRSTYMQYELGIDPSDFTLPGEPPTIPEASVGWHIHKQTDIAMKTWSVFHNMNTQFMMRPVVFDLDGNEIDYDDFIIPNQSLVVINFSVPVTGELHLISLNLPANMMYVFNGSGSTWTIDHNLDIPVDIIALSPILDGMGKEITANSVEFVSDNQILIKFTQPVSGRVTVGNVSGYGIDTFTENISTEFYGDLPLTQNRVYGKPLVLQADKEIFYNYHRLMAALRRVGFSVETIASIIVVEKQKL